MAAIRFSTGLLLVLLLAGMPVRAQQKEDHADLARVIQQVVATQLPREYEDRKEWGKTVPIPENLENARLRRRVKVGDHEEFPDGPWRRTRLWVDDPARDVQIRVQEVRKTDASKTHIRVEAVAALHGERQRQQWLRGLPLLDITAQADAVVSVALECDVAISLNTTAFPPELRVEPRVTQLHIGLKSFTLKQVGKLIKGDLAEKLGHELQGMLEDLLKHKEPEIKEKANEAIARALKQNKGKLSADALLKAPVQDRKE
jgi:hypothetical protein